MALYWWVLISLLPKLSLLRLPKANGGKLHILFKGLEEPHINNDNKS